MKKQHAMFLVVGIANTAIDFVLLNFFTAIIGLQTLVANIISVTVAIVFSYFANEFLVFESDKKSVQQAVRFLGVSLATAYVLQTLIIFILTEVWLWPIDVAQNIVEALEVNVSSGFVVTNSAKLAAVVSAAVINWFAYKHFVFRKGGKG